MVTRSPLACNNLANEADIMPFPNEEVTPPVTKMYFAIKNACGPGGGIPRGRVKVGL
jgi:hypothetical protein